MTVEAPPENLVGSRRNQERKELLRFVVCGSVDDGKSTLIGRLLYESGLVLRDELAMLVAESRRVGTQGDGLDLALLLDGLVAEREQGITIDVAYRYFTTERRKFIVADTPGHEQYTRNMVTGTSTADCAVVLADARKGVLTQTRRHSYIVALLGVRHLVLAVNKLDLVGYSEASFRRVESDFIAYGRRIGIDEVSCIPVSALRGDNVTAHTSRMPWYDGPTLLECLEGVEVSDQRRQSEPFRLPTQWVNHPDSEFRGCSGMIASGRVKPGDEVVVEPSGRRAHVMRIVTYDGDLDCAVAGQSVTLTLREELDVSRGDVLGSIDEQPGVGEQFEATIVWMADEPLLRGRNYLMQIGTTTAVATIAPLKYTIDLGSLEHVAADELRLNEIGVCELELDRPVAFDPYTLNRETGGFVLIDRISNATVGAGMINFELRRSKDARWQAIEVNKAAHARLKRQRPCVVWFTGLSGAGKATIANLIEKRLHSLGYHTYLLDGDNVRHGLNKDLGLTATDRMENIRRIAEISRLMADAGLIVMTAFISQSRNERRMARELLRAEEFIEVFIDARLRVAEARDRKDLYAPARRGKITNFTGVDSPYEPPEAPELWIDTTQTSPERAADLVVDQLRARRIIELR
jgi:bifunctional enzyme CysN/CysC